MKKLVLIGVCVVIFLTNGFAQSNLKGEKGVSSIGIMGGYAIESEKAVVGFDYRYNILNKLRLSPSVMYAVKKDNLDIWYLNADVNYLARITDDITLYPIGGFGFTVWTYSTPDKLPVADLEIPKKTDTSLRAGLNMGFGGEVRFTKDVIAGIEFRYNWTERFHNQAMIIARAAYYF